MQPRTERFTYAWGFVTRDEAEEIIEELESAGEVSPSERPKVATYRNSAGKRRYKITVDGMPY